ncbi:MAG: hypothetical protein IPO93_07405 [Actinobacteria bacterium]|nr:hypothetical protein [Actinomycetota bacterium]
MNDREEKRVLFVGDDWAEAHHDVEIVDENGRVLARRRLPPSAFLMMKVMSRTRMVPLSTCRMIAGAICPVNLLPGSPAIPTNVGAARLLKTPRASARKGGRKGGQLPLRPCTDALGKERAAAGIVPACTPITTLRRQH